MIIYFTYQVYSILFYFLFWNVYDWHKQRQIVSTNISPVRKVTNRHRPKFIYHKVPGFMIQSIPPRSIGYEAPISMQKSKRDLAYQINNSVNLATNLTAFAAPFTHSKLDYSSDDARHKEIGDSTFSNSYQTSSTSLR